MRRLSLAVILVLSLALSACSSSKTGTSFTSRPDQSSPTQSSPAKVQLPYDDMAKSLAAPYAQLRTYDLCGIHDRTVAEQLAQDKSVWLTWGDGGLSDSIGSCTLQMGAGKAWNGWTLTLTTGILDPNGKPHHIAGTDVVETQIPQLNACQYSLPVQGTGAIAVSANPGIDLLPTPELAKSCQIASDYFAALLPKITHPPTIDHPLSGPRFELAGVDPCSGFSPILSDVPNPTVSVTTDTDICSLKSSTPSLNPGGLPLTSTISVSLGSARTRVREGTQFTLGGLAAFHEKTATSLCPIQVPLNDQVFILNPNESDPGYVQAIELQMGETQCDNIQLADKIVTALLAQKPPPLPADFTPQIKVGNFVR